MNKIKHLPERIVLMLLLLLFALPAHSQFWYETYFTNFNDQATARNLTQTPDGGFLMSGNYDIGYLLKTDPNGTQQWRHDAFTSVGAQHVLTHDNNILFVHNYTASAPVFQKLTMNDSTLWTRSYTTPGFFNVSVQDMILLPDNGFLAVGGLMSGASTKVYALRLNQNGDTVWTRRYSITNNAIGYSVKRNSAGDFFIFSCDGFTPGKLLKIAPNGDSITVKPVAGHHLGLTNVFKSTSDGGFVAVTLSAGNPPDVVVEKFDALGDVQWTSSLPFASHHIANAITELTSGGFVLTGQITLAGPSQQLFVLKLTSTGSLIWERIFDPNTLVAGEDIIELPDGSLALCGYSGTTPVISDPLLMKLNGSGLLFTNVVKGNVYDDVNDNCSPQPGEQKKESWIVTLSNSSVTRGAVTDALGNYEILSDTGSYQLAITNASIYWDSASCSFNSTPLTLTTSPTYLYDTTTVDFPRKSLTSCPVIDVDISTPLLRRCFNSVYSLHYCNHGTADANNVSIEVVLDTLMQYLGSTVPAMQVNNVLTFNIGNVPVGECNTIYITVNLLCTAVLGQTHCVTAHAYPDSLCLPPNPLWDLASIEVEGNCVGNDSVRFKVRNSGIGNMSGSQNYYITEDNIMLFTTPFQLNSLQELTYTVPANGSTFRLQAEQSPYHPWNDAPVAVTVEGCGTNGSGTFSIGYFNDLPEYDYAPFHSVDCQENVGSYDPNDKRGNPEGYDTQHFITADDKIEYHVRFQNTGTDTAFTVVIRDTLSSFLDLATVISGASSHPYSFRIYDGNVLEWTFSNILLPDSFVNEPASHGFVKFMVSQKNGNPNGTVIHNSAGIYFDFNEPVITNQTWHTIGENFITLDVNENPGSTYSIRAFPNPFNEYTNIVIDGINGQEAIIKLWDVSGRLILQQGFQSSGMTTIYRNGLTSGVYFFTISSGNQSVGSGKLIVH